MSAPAPIVGFIAIGDDDLGAIEPLWRSLDANSARRKRERLAESVPDVVAQNLAAD